VGSEDRPIAGPEVRPTDQGPAVGPRETSLGSAHSKRVMPKSRIWTSRIPDISNYGGRCMCWAGGPYRWTSAHTDWAG